MSALEAFLDNVGNNKHTRLEEVNGKRVLYVDTGTFRKHLSIVLNLVHYRTKIDYAIVESHGRKKIELHSLGRERN